MAFSQPVSVTRVFDLQSCLLLHQHRAVFVRPLRSTALHCASDAWTLSSAARLSTHSLNLGHITTAGKPVVQALHTGCSQSHLHVKEINLRIFIYEM